MREWKYESNAPLSVVTLLLAKQLLHLGTGCTVNTLLELNEHCKCSKEHCKCPQKGIKYFGPHNALQTETKRCERAPLPPPLPSSCKKLLQQKASLPDGIHTIQLNVSTSPYKVYCHMADISGCGGGGWTLVMKVDGRRTTFKHNSPLWTNKESYAVEDGLEGLTEKESKLASYWNTPFKKICLGMTVNSDRRWMVLDYEASSLYSLIADGKYRGTTAGKNTWMSLIASSSLQANCNHEGFNIQFRSTKARLAFVANNENDCDSCDSWIGFGVYGSTCYAVYQTCGNRAMCAVNSVTNFPAFGYILVQ